MNNSKNFWFDRNNVKSFFNIGSAEQFTLQPEVARIIESLNPDTLLDYGCGDGFVNTLIGERIKKSLFDINSDSLLEVVSNLKDYNCSGIYKEEDIPDNYYDVVLLSLVLICIESTEDHKRILQKILKSKKNNGRLIFVTSHPCFRQFKFRPFHTSFGNENFEYLKEGQPFTVFMDELKSSVSIVDYHYSLSSTVNLLIECGFNIESVMEVKDIPLAEGEYYNTLYPPFLIIICN